ncbi:MAG: hypothetical protein RL748_4303 [Pseudomonadota bacterium]
MSLPVLAQQPESNEESQKVTVQGEKVEASGAREIVAGKIILGRDWLDRAASSTVSEALRRESSVSVGSGGKISLKGLSGYTQILLDGQASTGSANPLDMHPALIERVEIIHSATADSGPFGLAGTINVVTRNRRKALPKLMNLDLDSDGKGGRANMNLQGGWREATGTVLNLTVEAKRERTSRNGDSSWFASNQHGPVSVSTESTEVKALTQTASVKGTLNWKPTQMDELQFKGSLFLIKLGQDNSSNLTSGPPFVEGGIRPDSAQFGDWQNGSSATVGAQWRHKLSNGSNWIASLDLTEEQQKQNRDANTLWSPNLSNRLSVHDDTDKHFARGRWQFALPNRAGHRVQFALSSELVTQNSDKNTIINGIAASGVQLGSYEARLWTLNNAAWLQDDWNVSETLDVKLGLRQERRTARLSEGDFFARVAANLTAPSLNLAWKLDPEGERTVTLGLARSFSTIGAAMLNPRPDIAGTSLCTPNLGCGTNDPTTPDRAGNPALRYEKGWGLDFGLESQFGKESQWSLRGYRRWINDTFAWITEREVVPWANVPRWVMRPRNAGKASAYGVTIGLDTQLSDWIEKAPELGINASLQWNQSHLSTLPGPDNRLEGQQPWSGRLGLSYKVSDKPLELQADVLINPANWWQASSDRRIYTDTWRELSAKAIWTFSPQRKLILALQNLLTSRSRKLTEFDGDPALQNATRQNSRVNLSVRFESSF